MPDNIIRQAIDIIPRSFRHLGESLCLSLIFKGVAREVDTGAMDVGFDEDVDAADAIEGHFDIFVAVAVAEDGHVFAFSGVLFVAFCKNGVFG